MNHEELEEAVIESFDIRLLSIPKGFLQPEILGTGKPVESQLNVNTLYSKMAAILLFGLLANQPVLPRLRENILLNFEFRNKATRANLQVNKRPFWNKVYRTKSTGHYKLLSKRLIDWKRISRTVEISRV